MGTGLQAKPGQCGVDGGRLSHHGGQRALARPCQRRPDGEQRQAIFTRRGALGRLARHAPVHAVGQRGHVECPL
ncbi:hypothetical protein G6F32_017467 [Rhizopus arrhizus]|nr:hypothetical protein G6F32_017467 [Rhizopus arrhizus]